MEELAKLGQLSIVIEE